MLLKSYYIHEAVSNLISTQWLSNEGLIARLVNLLSPDQDPAMHTVVSELIKGIISMAAPSPGAGLSEGLHNGPASNIFAQIGRAHV